MAIVNQHSDSNPAKERTILCKVGDLSREKATRFEIGDLKLSASEIDGSVYVVSDMLSLIHI